VRQNPFNKFKMNSRVNNRVRGRRNNNNNRRQRVNNRVQLNNRNNNNARVNNPIRRVRRFRGIKNNRNMNRRPINNNNRMNKQQNNQIKKLTRQFNQLSLKLFPRVNNNNKEPRKNNKEPRTDKVATAYSMYKTTRYVSIFPTSARFKYMAVYTKFEISALSTGTTHLILFPYFCAFTNYDSSSYGSIEVNNGTAIDTATNAISVYIPTNNLPNAAIGPKISGRCGLYGTYRVVCYSAKITNLTAYQTKTGSYTIYKLNDTTFYPFMYDSQNPPDATNMQAEMKQSWLATITSNKDQTSIMKTYSACDNALINEYNIYEGNDIFQKPTEYLGASFQNSTYKYAQWNNNPTGINVVYQIDFNTVPSTNTYLVEYWQIIEVIPDPLLNLDTLAEIQKYVYTKNAIMQAKNFDNLTKCF